MASLQEKKNFINQNKSILSDPGINSRCAQFLNKTAAQAAERTASSICYQYIDPDQLNISQVNVLYTFLKYQVSGLSAELS